MVNQSASCPGNHTCIMYAGLSSAWLVVLQAPEDRRSHVEFCCSLCMTLVKHSSERKGTSCVKHDKLYSLWCATSCILAESAMESSPGACASQFQAIVPCKNSGAMEAFSELQRFEHRRSFPASGERTCLLHEGRPSHAHGF